MNGATSSGPFVLFDAETTLLAGELMQRIAAGLALRMSASERDVAQALAGLDQGKFEAGAVSAKDLAEALRKAIDVKVSPTKVSQWLGQCLVYDTEGMSQLARWAKAERAAVVGGSAPGLPERLRTDSSRLLPPERHLYSHEAGASLSTPEFYKAAAEAFMKDPSEMVLYSRSEARRNAATAAGCQAMISLGIEPPSDEPEATEAAAPAGDPSAVPSTAPEPTPAAEA